MNVGAHPFDKPFKPSSANVTLNPLNTDLYLAASTCKRHFTKSNGTTYSWKYTIDIFFCNEKIVAKVHTSLFFLVFFFWNLFIYHGVCCTTWNDTTQTAKSKIMQWSEFTRIYRKSMSKKTNSAKFWLTFDKINC